MDMSAELAYGRKMGQLEKGNRLLAHLSAEVYKLSTKPRREFTSLGYILAVELLYHYQQDWPKVPSPQSSEVFLCAAQGVAQPFSHRTVESRSG